MKTIEISDEEDIDRVTIIAVKETYSKIKQLGGNFDDQFLNLYDVHSAMYPLHDILVRTKNIELKAYLGEVILKLNGIRAKLKNDVRTYG